MASFDPAAQAQVQEVENPGITKKKQKGNKLTRNTSHPFCVIITIIFTAFPVIYGIITLLPLFNISFVVDYIVHSVGIALTFYHNKNFAGRFLGKLRWHTYVVDGKTYYYFEAMSKEGQSKCDSFTFWSCIIVNPLYYLGIGIGYCFSFKITVLPIPIVGVIAGMTNLVGYIKCSADFRKKVKKMATDIGKRAAQQQLETL